MKNKNTIIIAVLAVSMGMVLPAANAARTTFGAASNAVQEISKGQAKAILSAYLELKDALVETDAEAAGKAAGELISAIGDSKDKSVAQMKIDAEHIAHTKDIGHQRQHFSSISDDLYALIKATGANEKTLYRQYCPMAFNNEGAYWLSEEKEIRNPYFGDKMLKCGSVQETIK